MLSTCNRVEGYASGRAFHGGLSVIGAALPTFRHGACTTSPGSLRRYAEAGVEHLFASPAAFIRVVSREQQVLDQYVAPTPPRRANHTAAAP